MPEMMKGLSAFEQGAVLVVLAISIFGPETFARGSFLFALPVRTGAAASLGDVARCSAETLHHR